MMLEIGQMCRLELLLARQRRIVRLLGMYRTYVESVVVKMCNIYHTNVEDVMQKCI